MSKTMHTIIVATTSSGYWGKGKDIAEAIRNARVSSMYTSILLACVVTETPDEVAVDGDGRIVGASSENIFHLQPYQHSIRVGDLVTTDMVFEAACEKLDAMRYDKLAGELSEAKDEITSLESDAETAKEEVLALYPEANVKRGVAPRNSSLWFVHGDASTVPLPIANADTPHKAWIAAAAHIAKNQVVK